MSGGARGINLRFDFYGDVQVDRTLNGLAVRVRDASPAFDAMGDRLARAEERQFSSQGGYGSGGWPALSPAYGAWKARHYPGKPILERTGLLRESLTQRPFGIDENTGTTAVFGSGVHYGAFHQHGGGHLPRRRPLELPEDERRAWGKVMQRWLVDGGTTP